MFVLSRQFPYGVCVISLAGKAALITGGSRGIGAATVKLFARAGADVVFNYNRNKDAATAVEQEARKHGTRIESRKADLGRMADARRLVEYAEAHLGRVDILVANDEMMRVSLKSIYAVTHFAVEKMIKQRSGRVIAISSTAGQRGEAFHSHYAAAKGGMISFVKSLAGELARYRVLVNCVAPGWVETDMSNPVLHTKAGAKLVQTQIPLGRAATPEEIAGPILFLASDLATFVTGEVLNVNGGAVLCG